MRVGKIVHGLCASHIIPNHPGKCRRLHGHQFLVKVLFSGGLDRERGMVVDFGDIKKAVEPLFQRLDHQHLNFYLVLPTAENLAFYFAHELYYRLTGMGASLIEVSVNETDSTSAIWTAEEDLEELLRPVSEGEKRGWDSPVSDIPVFQTEDDMVQVLLDKKRDLVTQYKEMHQIGSEIAAIERYFASLDERAASRLKKKLEEMGGVHALPWAAS